MNEDRLSRIETEIDGLRCAPGHGEAGSTRAIGAIQRHIDRELTRWLPTVVDGTYSAGYYDALFGLRGVVEVLAEEYTA